MDKEYLDFRDGYQALCKKHKMVLVADGDFLLIHKVPAVSVFTLLPRTDESKDKGPAIIEDWRVKK